ncbi:hypothetical protein [Paenibacillus sp. Y412MC10]|uniref:hypothetical protein n=1 Tax=Geobacillus sp. (strain Y412MC10) TaxID=481743 RepID=UPI0011A8CB79|nr:hypothetical protein [Paenibacillus sp. Y412MC10]
MQKWAAGVGIFIIAAMGLMLVYIASHIDFVVIAGFSVMLAVLGVLLMNQRELLENQRRDRQERIRRHNELLRGKDSESLTE